MHCICGVLLTQHRRTTNCMQHQEMLKIPGDAFVWFKEEEPGSCDRVCALAQWPRNTTITLHVWPTWRPQRNCALSCESKGSMVQARVPSTCWPLASTFAICNEAGTLATALWKAKEMETEVGSDHNMHDCLTHKPGKGVC